MPGVNYSDIEGFGVEIGKLEYDGFLDWLVGYIPVATLWKAHPTYVLCEAIFIIGGILIIAHSLKQGGRWPFLVIATITHGYFVEFMAYFFPHIDNFWHAQGVLTFYDRRMALYIMFLYTVFYYQSSWAMSKLKLKSAIAEHMAAGLMTVLIDMPYDINGAKYVHWIWHDTDPNIEDRFYWVPWNSFYFHVCFSTCFQFWFHTVRKWMDRRPLTKWERGTLRSELVSILAATFLSMPSGCLIFIPFYHPLHDFLGVHSEVTSCSILIIFTSIVWKYDRISNRYSQPPKWDFLSKLLILQLIGHYAVNWCTAVFYMPEDVVTMGVHEPIGPCNETIPIETILKTLSRRKYLCVDDYDEKYYDFHCLPGGKPPSSGSYWYTACGTPHENRTEYITVMTVVCFVAFMVFSSFHFDYDRRLVERLTKAERKRLEEKESTAKKVQ